MSTPLHPHDAAEGSQPRLRGMVRKLGAATSARNPVGASSHLPAAEDPAPSVWSRLWAWWRARHAPATTRPRTIDAARADFHRAVWDLHDGDATGLRLRVDSARSLRELWHLRTELYGLVARHFSQVEAENRLARVNRHFPVGAAHHMSREAGSRHG